MPDDNRPFPVEASIVLDLMDGDTAQDAAETLLTWLATGGLSEAHVTVKMSDGSFINVPPAKGV